MTVLLQDYDQMTLVPLPGEGLVVGPAQSIDDSLAGLAFQTDEIVERPGPTRSGCTSRCSTAPTAWGFSSSPSTTSTSRPAAGPSAGRAGGRHAGHQEHVHRPVLPGATPATDEPVRGDAVAAAAAADDDHAPGRCRRRARAGLRRGRRQLRLRPQRRHPAPVHDRRDGPRAGRRCDGHPRHRRLPPCPSKRRRAGRPYAAMDAAIMAQFGPDGFATAQMAKARCRDRAGCSGSTRATRRRC